MDIAQVLAQVGLTRRCSERALAWCEEMGAEEISEVLDEFEDFAGGLGLDGESEQILKRTVEKVVALGGDIAFSEWRGAEAQDASGHSVQGVLLKLFEEEPSGAGSVDGIIAAESVASAVVEECDQLGIPVYIASRRASESRPGGAVEYYVRNAKAAAAGSHLPVGVIKPFQPNLFEPRESREEKPTAEVWSVAEHPGGEEGGEGQRLAKMFLPVPAAWARVLQQKQSAQPGSQLDASRLAKSTTEEGVVVYEKPPEGGVVVLGCGNSYGGLALAKFFAWSAEGGEEESQLSTGRVLELGAGTGLIGLTMGRFGAHVTLTDYELETLQLMKLNIDANGLSSSVTTQFLEWGDDSTYMLEEPFDAIVAGESLYDAYAGEGNAMLLAHAFRAHMREGSSTVAYLAYRHRSENPLRFFSALADEGFRVERLENESGEAVGCSRGPRSAYDGSSFVELPLATCTTSLRKARFAAENKQLTQIIRMSRRRPQPA